MLNNKDTLSYLQALDLSRDEAKLYFELLRAPHSHLELARATGINRTKVYRLADQLEKRSLITTQTDDRGTQLVAADPRTLEVELVTGEEKLKNQRAVFKQLLPQLEAVKNQNQLLSFSVQTYDGVEGFKQMLWHELKAKDEVVIFGQGKLEDLVVSTRWAEKHRTRTMEAGYKIRELRNPGEKVQAFTKLPDFMNYYQQRPIAPETLRMDHQTTIYNDTVAIYYWRNEQKVGIEIVNKANAAMMRQMFEHYWQMAGT